jgi:hypothetical protein
MLCVGEREEAAVDSAWVTDFGEGFGEDEATRGSKKSKYFLYISRIPTKILCVFKVTCRSTVEDSTYC